MLELELTESMLLASTWMRSRRNIAAHAKKWVSKLAIDDFGNRLLIAGLPEAFPISYVEKAIGASLAKAGRNSEEKTLFGSRRCDYSRRDLIRHGPI